MKILIVDDEPIILTGIENILINEFGDRVELVKAYDGINALEILKRFTPDLIITDICMPEMSGLELIEYVLKNNVCSRFLILSGYADFEYARQAIQYKALDYILKPIDKNQLVGHVNRLFKVISQEKEELIKGELDKIREVILYDAPYEEFFMEKNKVNDIFPAPFFKVVVLQIEGACSEPTHDDFRSVLSQFFGKYHSFALQSKKQLVILGNFEKHFSDRLLYKEFSSIKLKHSCSISNIGMSGICNSLEQIHSYFNDALRYLYLNKYSHKAVLNEDNDFMGALTLIDYHDIAKILEAKNQVEMDRLLDEYLGKLIYINQRHSFHLNSIYSIIISDIAIYLQEIGLSSELITGMENNSLKDTFINEGQLQNKLRSIFVDISQLFGNMNPENKYSESVTKMLDFINANYMKDISLDAMAETVNLHPNYASSLFKKEIGTAFIQYLNSYRIMKAKAFLKKNSELSLDKIAEMVGYENSRHFIKVFKKYCNTTPGEYRNSKISN